MSEARITYDITITDEPMPKKVTFDDFAVNDLTVTVSDWSQVWRCQNCGHEVSNESPTDPNGTLCVKCGNIAMVDGFDRVIVRSLSVNGHNSKHSATWQRRLEKPIWDGIFGGDTGSAPSLAAAMAYMVKLHIEPTQGVYFAWGDVVWSRVGGWVSR